MLKADTVIFSGFRMRLRGGCSQKTLSLPFQSGLVVSEIHRTVGRSEAEKCTFYTWTILPGTTGRCCLVFVGFCVVVLGILGGVVLVCCALLGFLS